jgi:hypothetical protein
VRGNAKGARACCGCLTVFGNCFSFPVICDVLYMATPGSLLVPIVSALIFLLRFAESIGRYFRLSRIDHANCAATSARQSSGLLSGVAAADATPMRQLPAWSRPARNALLTNLCVIRRNAIDTRVLCSLWKLGLRPLVRHVVYNCASSFLVQIYNKYRHSLQQDRPEKKTIKKKDPARPTEPARMSIRSRSQLRLGSPLASAFRQSVTERRAGKDTEVLPYLHGGQHGVSNGRGR